MDKEQPGYQKVYALWDDVAGVKRLQRATLDTDGGLARDHGLVGSDEWWHAVYGGDLPLHTVKGTICDLAMESMNDWPTFKIFCDDGSVTRSITRELLPLKGEPYKLGRDAIWQYVVARYKKPVEIRNSEGAVVETWYHSSLTIAIWLGEMVSLFRPIGHAELALIAKSGFATFPPRLPEQPIFYPVCNYRYAEEIASKWNAKDGMAYVTRFEVAKRHLDQYETHQVGGQEHLEYWIPSERLEEFNASIIGKIRVVKSFAPTEAEHA